MFYWLCWKLFLLAKHKNEIILCDKCSSLITNILFVKPLCKTNATFARVIFNYIIDLNVKHKSPHRDLFALKTLFFNWLHREGKSLFS